MLVFSPAMALLAFPGSSYTCTPTFHHLDLQSPSSPRSFPFFLSKPSRRPTFLCHSSSSSSSNKQSPPAPNSTKTESTTPSLSDQLRPLSLTLLKDKDRASSNSHCLPTKPKPTWVNPSKPKPSVLSPHRHRRPPYSLNPDLRHLSLLSRSLRQAPDEPAAFSAALTEAFPLPPSQENALFVLNSLRSWPKALQFFDWLKTHADQSPLDTILYNVTMKSLRAGRQHDLVERLAQEMIDRGVPLDNVTYSTIITSAKRCCRFDRAVEWFERMYRTGVIPDEVTYSAALDVYAQLGKRGEVMTLYERARAGGWTPDSVAFSVLAKMFGAAGDYDGIQYVLQEMKSLGVKPDLVVYNTLLEAMGKAGKPGLARSLFDEMVSAGLSPNEKTLTALIKIYGKARWSRDALELWERMRSNKWPMDFILYNTLLSMCADLGLEEEAEKLFEDMKRPERGTRPDNWSYTAMINIYGSGGKAERALELFEEMLENGVEPNIMSYTCLIQCLGKAGRIGDAMRVFETSVERGVIPDDRLCGCLLSLVALCEEGEMEMVLASLEKANPRVVELIKMLRMEEVGFDEVQEEFRGMLNEATVEARRPFCNCLIDICRNHGFPSQRANDLLHLGTLYGFYPNLHAKSSDVWSLNLRSLSFGAADTAFEEWIKSLSDSVEKKEVLPQSFSINTGAGTHRFSQGLASAFASRLEKLAAPFRRNEETSGNFVASREDFISWVRSGAPSAVFAAL
ncbi:pentatricopeptide repeat-containing protein At5g46580, chloroplastic [Phoenix dactylifera]|uniref:Pentatricopeptide repeat-containing protein At5g46580, chloroplastic n=1 Tax=Phoenix dactylifera TaxID=42345 RepID=A0A8B7BVI9_PHODC|nr:pentatricopeptide repeat-containing protein At5g46580, chloroplastic [Phoenix dactylifera]